MKLTITADIETTLTRDEFGEQLQAALDIALTLDEALEDLFARFHIPARIDNASVALVSGRETP